MIPNKSVQLFEELKQALGTYNAVLSGEFDKEFEQLKKEKAELQKLVSLYNTKEKVDAYKNTIEDEVSKKLAFLDSVNTKIEEQKLKLVESELALEEEKSKFLLQKDEERAKIQVALEELKQYEKRLKEREDSIKPLEESLASKVSIFEQAKQKLQEDQAILAKKLETIRNLA